jgi:hypothetical protein
MTNTAKQLTKLAVAIGLIGSLTFSATAPSFARSLINAYQRQPPAAALARHQGAANAYGSATPTDLCRQTGPITLPATNPVCNERGWYVGR